MNGSVGFYQRLWPYGDGFTYENADAAQDHGECEGAPVSGPGQAVPPVSRPGERVLRAHTIEEREEHACEEHKRDELEDQTDEEELYVGLTEFLCQIGRRTYVSAKLGFVGIVSTSS